MKWPYGGDEDLQGARCKAQPTIVKVIVLKPGRLCVLPTTLVLTTIKVVKVSAIKGILELELIS